MTPDVSSPDTASHPWHPGSPEAQWLAEALRACRLTLLTGEAGAGKSALLTDGVLPLLRRRAVDAAVSAPRFESQVILPFPERRSRARARLAEIVIFFDAWNEAPLRGLHERIDAALREAQVEPDPHRASLPERVHSLGERFGTRFLFVFDRFDELLSAPRPPPCGVRPPRGSRKVAEPHFLESAPEGADACGRLLDQLVQLLNQRLPANALIALRSEAQAVFEPFGDRLYGVEAEALHLSQWGVTAPVVPSPPWHSVARASAGSPAQPVANEEAIAAPFERAPRYLSHEAETLAASSTQPGDIYASIEHTLARTSAAQFPLLLDDVRGLTRPASPTEAPPEFVVRLKSTAEQRLRAEPRASEVNAAHLTHTTEQSPQAELRANQIVAQPGHRSRRQWFVWALVPIMPLVLIFVALRHGPASTRADPAPPADVARPSIAAGAIIAAAADPAASPARPPAALPIATAPALPSLELAVDDEGAEPALLPAELARALAADHGVDLRIRSTAGGPASLVGPTAPQRLAIVRYDALQAAARASPRPALAVVAPLYTEEVYVVVRADSPLRFIHQIEGRRINAGSPQSGRGLTATTLYRRMFGKSMPTTPSHALDARIALQRLIAGKELDAVVLVAPQPAAWLAALPPETRRAVKLLSLDADHPASQRALQIYLPATLNLARSIRGTGTPVPTLASLAFLVTTGTPDAGQPDALGRLAQSLCRSLPELQRTGHPKWREVRAGLQLKTAWPVASASESAWSACAPATGSATNLPR